MKQLLRFFTFVVLALYAGFGLAQSTASLSGIVKDPSGAVLPGAQVMVHAVATGTDRATKSDSAGAFAMPSLQPGEYTVTVTAQGFANYTLKSFVLQVDQKADIDVPLALQSAGETIEVVGGAPVIDTGTITVGTVIDRQTVQEIPLNGRHFLDLTVLTPGSVTPPANGTLTAPSRGLGSNSFNTAGNREDSVNFQINGVNLNDLVQNQITFQPSINTTSEFKINNSTYSAEYGRSSGSIVNVSTRSGTNQFHGEIFDYLRNEALDARNYFNQVQLGQPKGILKRNNFGASVGGPIWHDKTFFFASYEGLRQSQGLVLSTTTLTTAQAAGVTDPVSKALLNFIPVTPTGSYSAIAPGPVQVNQGTMDILHNFNQADILHGFYAIQKDVRTEPNLQNNNIIGFGDNRAATRQILTINETHVFSPRLVNEARIGFNRVSIAFAPNNTTDPASLGMRNYPTGVNAGGGLPQITIAGYSLNFGGPSTFPQGRFDTLGVISDTMSYTVGRHSLRFGGEARRFANANFGNDAGTITFVATPAIPALGQPQRTALQNFQLGQAATFTITPNATSSRIYSNAVGGFIVDSIHITPDLVFEAGFRFEWNGTPSIGNNRAVVFDPANASLYALGTNNHNAPYAQNYNYEPRVGFTYDIFGNSKTILRGGYAIMADQPETNLVTALTTNTPLTNRVSVTATTTTPLPANPVPTVPLSNLYAAANAVGGLSITAVDPNFRNAYTETFNLNLQHELPGGVGLSVGYYGSVGKHLREQLNINQINANGTRAYQSISSSSPIAANASLAAANLTMNKGAGISNYNAMWLTAKKNAGHGLQFTGTWNYTKSLDLGSQPNQSFIDITRPYLNYGPSDFDVRHRIAVNGIYDLPFKANRAVAGFRFSSIAQFQTGNPLNITVTGTPTGTTGQHPNQVAPLPYAKSINSATGFVNWFANPTALNCNAGVPTPGCVFQLTSGFGNVARNSAVGPRFTDVDMSLEKNTKLFESLSLQLRIDAFDIFNHVNLGNPGTSSVPGSTSFGVITATRFPVSDLGSSRQLQLSGKIIF